MNVLTSKINYEDYLKNGICKGIFNLQDRLLDKFIDIQSKNDNTFTLHRDLDVNDPKDQTIIKWYAYCVIEEMMEMLMAKNNIDHRREEFADALSFATELMISLNVKEFEDDIFESTSTFEFESGNTIKPIYWLCSACNCLKCKPWKNDRIITDADTFKFRIRKFYNELLKFSVQIFESPLSMFDFYAKKNNVNLFRQESNY